MFISSSAATIIIPPAEENIKNDKITKKIGGIFGNGVVATKKKEIHVVRHRSGRAAGALIDFHEI